MSKIEKEVQIKELLQNDIKLPDVVNARLEEAYGKIRTDKVHMKRLKEYKRKRLYSGLGAAAAVVCIIITLSGVLYVNPALARDIPLLGNIFGRLQSIRDESTYPDKDRTAYQNIEEHSKAVTEPGNVAEDQGITVTVSDAYCDGYDLYFTVSLRTDNEELNTADYLMMLSYKEDDPIAYYPEIGINDEEVSGVIQLQKSENGIYAGLVRIGENYLKAGGFSEEMTVNLDLNAVGAHMLGEEEQSDIPDFSRVGFKSVRGNWPLRFTASMDTSGNKMAVPNLEVNGFTLEKAVQTPSNLHITISVPEQYSEEGLAMVLTDEVGNRIYQESGQRGASAWDLVFDHSDANQFVLQVIDKNAGVDENGNLVVLAEIPISMD
ncbi:DUF4179 domain-containing protein [Muricomes intestini]|uniref:DUF4179 domain-containing protein n=2 Tax=Muricomes intestini TaxID=1796634 RepID=UPI002FE00B6A